MDSPAWQRLREKFSGLFEPVDARAPPPEPPKELKKWAWDVSAVVTMVMTYSGFLEYQRLRGEPIVIPKELPPALHDMYLRNQQSGQLSKIASRALVGGWHALVFGGLFYGIDTVSAIARDEEDLANAALSGLITGSLYGSLIPGNFVFRTTRMLLGGAIGIAAGSAVGYLQHDLTQSLSQPESAESPAAMITNVKRHVPVVDSAPEERGG